MSICPICHKEFDVNSVKFINGQLICPDCAKPAPPLANAYRDDELRCPRCGSKNVLVQKKGYAAGSGCCGALLFGPIGLLCGAIDSNKIKLHCLRCGNIWSAGANG